VPDNLPAEKYLSNGHRITDQEIGLVLGHTDKVDGRKLETGNYGIGSMQLKLRKEIIEQISYSFE